MSLNCRIHVLMFGNHHDLHKRITDSFVRNLTDTPVRVWCNTVCDETKRMLSRLPWNVTYSDENLPKYKVMRLLFTEPLPKWTVWFDDDAYINVNDWEAKMQGFLETFPDIRYFGQKWFVHHLPGQEDFIRAAPWYKGVPWEMLPTRKPGVKKPGITFAQGSYWWLRTDLLRDLDWPDSRLSHNGGDTLLGEAVRQQGFPLHHYHYGVKPNAAPRRGLNERPAGSMVDVRR